MTTHEATAAMPTPLSVLGTGAMGTALADRLLEAGHTVTVWKRSREKISPLVDRGAGRANTAAEAVARTDVVVVCLLDHASVVGVLAPLTDRLAGKTLVNVTTTTPRQARELSDLVTAAGAHYLDGGIMAVPEMIGQPDASILYSGSAPAFERHRALLERWGTTRYFGPDPGMASLYDLALLAGMYVMFAGFMHGAAMVAPAGVSAREFAADAASWLTSMTGAFDEYARVIDGGDYTVPGQQSLEFSDLTDILSASAEQGISTEVVAAVQGLIKRQIDAGHGQEGFARLIESITSP